MKFKCFIEINIIGLISPALNLHNNNSIYLTCLSAEQDTPIPTGHEAPWRGNRITLTSWQKYLPPNCAPIPNLCVSWWIFCSISKSRNPLPCSFPYKNVFFSTYAFIEIVAYIFFNIPLNNQNLNKIIPSIFKLLWYQEIHLLHLFIVMLYVIVISRWCCNFKLIELFPLRNYYYINEGLYSTVSSNSSVTFWMKSQIDVFLKCSCTWT